MHLIMLAMSLAAAPAPAVARDQSLREFLQQEFRGMRDDLRRFGSEDPQLRYNAAFVDLSGDARDEAIVYLTGNGVCGSGGCVLHIYTPDGHSWREVTALSITRPPIRVLNTKSHGWRDVSVFVAGGGEVTGYHVQLKFDGRTYSTNPSVPPATRLGRGIQGRVLIDRAGKGRLLY
jgi:hypothetical protein